MAFEKGKPKPPNSGRKKGSLNKKTVELLEIFEEHNYCPARAILELLNSPNVRLSPEDKLNTHIKMMDYVFARRKAVEHSGSIDGVTSSVTIEEYLKQTDKPNG